MKKLILSSLLFGSLLATAQNQRTTIIAAPNEPVGLNKKTYSALHKKSSMANHKTANQTGTAWFNYVDFIELVTPATQVFSPMHVFPDSTIILGFDSGNLPVYPYIHKAGVYIDPSFMAQQTIIDDKFATYSIDSVSVGYLYDRATSNSVTDSLIIQVIAENHALDYTLSSGAFSYQDIEFNFATQTIKPSTPVLKRIAYALTISDTCEGGVYKQIKVATPGIAPITNSKKTGVIVSFKPGYTWTINDTLIGGSKNAFYVLSSEQNGASTDPTYYGIVNDYTSDMNMSYILDQSVRYNMNANGWNGYLLPTYAYTTPFAYESHDIGVKLSVSITNVKAIEQKGFALGQNMPNPFTKESTVNFQLAKDASSVLFTVTDVMGRIVSSEKAGTTAGSHSIKVGAFAPGVYYYSLNVDGNVTSKKMIVE